MQATDVQMIADRWMLESRRLINWGSYEGYHEFRPSTDHKLPVTLLAGASESGKSTLVDAQISLLYPTGTPFNKASNSGRSERSDYTYLRGMVGVGKEGIMTLDDAVKKVQDIHDAVKAINPQALVICHGGPIATPEDAEYVLSRTHGVVGFYGASSAERLPTEQAIREQVSRFGSLTLSYYEKQEW